MRLQQNVRHADSVAQGSLLARMTRILIAADVRRVTAALWPEDILITMGGAFLFRSLMEPRARLHHAAQADPCCRNLHVQIRLHAQAIRNAPTEAGKMGASAMPV